MRPNGIVVFLAAALVLAWSGAASAAKPLVTPFLGNWACCTNPPPTDTFTCVVVNTGPGSTIPNVIIELVDRDGDTIVDAGPLALAPNDPRVLIWEASSVHGAYCRVTGSVSPRRTKITLCNGETAGGPCQAIVTGP